MAYPLVKMEKYDQKFAQAAKGIRRLQCQKILASHQFLLTHPSSPPPSSSKWERTAQS